MSRKPDDLYGTFGSVPTERNRGVGSAHLSVNASGEDFGSQVGNSIQHAGAALGQAADQVHESIIHSAKITAESKVNDDYANNYAPASAKLRQDFDMLRGQDKIAGYEGYKNGLMNLNKQYIESQPSPYGKQIMQGMLTRNTASDIESAGREMVKWQKEFQDQSTYAALKTNNDLAAQNYNNPDFTQSVMTQNDNHILMQLIDAGHDPNNPESKVIIKTAQQQNQGEMAAAMINRAIDSGDAANANRIRAEHGSVIPGYQKLAIDNTIHTANIRQTSADTMSALKLGQPIPVPIGAPAPQVQALVANAAKGSEIHPNNALAVLQIESTNGQNLGERGTLGQDKGSKGRPLEEQAKALCDNLKYANARAGEVLGRAPEEWEGYVVYQQGSGGGAALLKAAQESPNRKAVDILKEYYKNPADALSAVSENGGNSTMTARDFVGHIQQVYNDNARRSDIDFGDAENPGEKILAPYNKEGVTVQPGATPAQSLRKFENDAPELLERINSIANIEQRESMLRSYGKEHEKFKEEASAYLNGLNYQVQKIGADPNFTSMDQMPTEMYARLMEDHPESVRLLERIARVNGENKTIAPLDFNRIESLPLQLASRVEVSNISGVSKIISDKDKDKLSNMWEQQSTSQRLQFLTNLSNASQRPEDYSKMIQQFRPDSPVTAAAGSFVRMEGKVAVETPLFGDDTFVTPNVVAKRLLEGEELLNPTSKDKKENGTGKVFPMPSDTGANGLRQEFNSYVGDAFRGSPSAYSQAYQAYRAYYASEASQRGIFSGELDSDVSKISARAVIGNVVDKNNSNVIAPWGMDEDAFNDMSKISFDRTLEKNGYNPEIIKWDDVKLQNKPRSKSAYYVMAGAGYLLDKEGAPLSIDVDFNEIMADALEGVE